MARAVSRRVNGLNLRSRLLAAAGAVGLVGGLIVVPGAAAADPNTLVVHVGSFLGAMPAAGGAPADGMRFYAPTLNVTEGDWVRFELDSFHTATLLPKNVDVDSWVE
ncbi:MAG: hypothetical protein QOK47_271, partial [Actinomycetota bacterium]|nr:hypothetical protein [Actinomycetota bacterium]